MNNIKVTKLPDINVKILNNDIDAESLAKMYIDYNDQTILFTSNMFYKRNWKNNKYSKFQTKTELKNDLLSFMNQNGLSAQMTNKVLESTITTLKGICALETEIQPPYFIQRYIEDRFIPLKNGILNLDSFLRNEDNLLYPHTKDYFCTTCLDFDYDITASCPTFRDILDFALPCKEEQRLLQQWIGYNLIFSNKYERFVIMIGKGRNGKSLILFIIRLMLGEDNISTLALEDFGKRFQKFQTVGKLANIVGEISDSSKFPETAIKSYISGEPFTADIKFHDPIIAYPTARVTVACNNFPYFRDTTDGLWRRIILLAFKRQVPEEDVRPELMTEEFWKDSGELPGIFNWALEGLKDLEENGLLIPESCKDHLIELKSNINPIETFLLSHMKEHEDATEISKDIYLKYEKYCDYHGYKPVSSGVIGREIKKVFPKAEQGKTVYIQGTGIRSRTWNNIRLKTLEELESADE